MLLKQLGHIGARRDAHAPGYVHREADIPCSGSILDAVGRFDCIGHRKQSQVILHLEVAHALVGNARIECVVGKVS